MEENLLTKKKNTQFTTTTKGQAYRYDDIIEGVIQYFGRDELAANVWVNKYALKDSFGNIYEKSPDEMHRRLAREFARIEAKYDHPLSEDEIFETLSTFKYIVPQGGSMAGIGNNFQVSSLSNCFVIGNASNADSYGAILKNDEEQVQLMKRRGGVGHDLSTLRPKGAPVMNSAITSTGILPFMERYSNSTREVAQDGRRGALMLSISVKHPDAGDFINAKTDTKKVTGANVSVRVDDAFMHAVRNDEEYIQQFPVDTDHPTIKKSINANTLWKQIVHNAWKTGEPGVLFWDTVLRESVPDCYADLGFRTISTNPCGEIPLCGYDSCRLVAINLFSYVVHPFSSKASFDFELFRKHVCIAQRLMDDLVDLELEKIDKILAKINADPEPDEIKRTERLLWEKIRKKAIEGRRTGLGITAEGDMLAALSLQYGSEAAIDFSEKVHQTFTLTAYKSSVNLAKERGAFPVYNTKKERANPFINRLKEADEPLYADMKKYGRRNIALLTIAPTGTTSLMTQTTSGIEPAFKIAYKRRRKVNPNDRSSKIDFVDEVGDAWESYQVFHHKFKMWLEHKGYNVEEVSHMSDKDLQKIIEKSPYYKATANDIDWISKVKMQGRIQKWIDHSISATVNVPENTPEELVATIYETAWEHGCKGVTIYREGARSGVLVSAESQPEMPEDFKNTMAPKRPSVLDATVVRFMNNDEKWIAVVGLYKSRPYEIFTGRAEDSFMLPAYVKEGRVIKNKNEAGKSRYDFQYIDKDGYRIIIEGLSRSFNKEYWNYAKLISGVLRHGMPIQNAVDMVANLNLDEESLNTWKNGVIRTLMKFIPSGTSPADNHCPECGAPALVYEEGCLNCKNCGHSKCS